MKENSDLGLTVGIQGEKIALLERGSAEDSSHSQRDIDHLRSEVEYQNRPSRNS